MALPPFPVFFLLRARRRCGRSANKDDRTEERRKAKALAYYERKKLALRQQSEAKKNATVDAKTEEALKAYGY